MKSMRNTSKARARRMTWAEKQRADYAESARAYLMTIADPEDRARFLRSSGWEGMPELEDIERNLANAQGGINQGILAGLQEALPRRTPDAADRKREHRIRLAHPEWFDEPSAITVSDTANADRAELPGVAGDMLSVETPVIAIEEQPVEAMKGGADASSGSSSRAISDRPAAILISHRPKDPCSIAAGIERHLYKSGRIPRPAGYRPTPPVDGSSNPFRDKAKERSSDLSVKDACKVYNAIAYAMWRHEAVMNTHVIIVWRTLGVDGHGRATKILSSYLNESQKWASVGKHGQDRQRRRQRTGYGFEFRYVYVHENGMGNGFHTHILCTVPREVSKEFAAWSMDCLSRLARHGGDGRSVFVVVAKGRTEESNVARGWFWFRYLMKQLRPGVAWGYTNERPQQLREILKVWPYRNSWPVTCMKLAGVSEDIGRAAQKEAGFVSRLMHGDLADIYAGRELEDGRVQREMAKIIPTLRL